MKQVEDSIEKRDELLNHQWINLVGDSKGFEGETAEDKRVLMDLVGKTSFAWTEEKGLQREADNHGYGLSIIIFDKTEWKEDYYRDRDRGIRTKTRTRIRTKNRKNRTLKLRRKAA